MNLIPVAEVKDGPVQRGPLDVWRPKASLGPKMQFRSSSKRLFCSRKLQNSLVMEWAEQVTSSQMVLSYLIKFDYIWWYLVSLASHGLCRRLQKLGSSLSLEVSPEDRGEPRCGAVFFFQPGYPSGHLKKTRNWQNLAAKIVNLVGSPKSLTSLSPGCLRCSFCCCMKECFWEMDIRGISKQMLCRITDDLVKEYKTLV